MYYGIVTNSDIPAEIGRLVTMKTLNPTVRATFTDRTQKDLRLSDISVISLDAYESLRRSAVNTWAPLPAEVVPDIEGLRTLLTLDWSYMPDWKSWEIRFADANGTPLVLWLSYRPSHCNLGRFSGHFEGLTGFDPATEGFPRYYMDLDVGKRELREWAAWRVFKFNRNITASSDVHKLQGRL